MPTIPRAARPLLALLPALPLLGSGSLVAQSTETGTIEVRCHVFQTVRDAPVVPGKATVVRVYANWTEEDGPLEGEQLEFFEGTVRIRAGSTDLPEMKKTFKRPDQHDRVADSVSADLSANHFGWRPEAGDGRRPVPVRATVELESPTTGETHSYDGACPVAALPSAPILNVDYYLVKTREWWDEEWDTPDWEATRQAHEDAGAEWNGPWEHVVESAHRLMENGTRFAVRNLPILAIRYRYGGVLGYDRWLFREDPFEVGSVLYDSAVRANPNADIIVGITPPSLDADDEWIGYMQSYDESGAHYSRGLGGKRVIFLELDPHEDPSETTLTHEIGHFYGLCHTLAVRPKGAPPAPGPRASIPSEPNDCVRARMHNEGFRVWPNGSGGVNKSETEGNGTLPDIEEVPVIPVMDSASTVSGPTWEFMPVEQYERLIYTMELVGLYDTGPRVPGSGSGGSNVPEPAGGPSVEVAPRAAAPPFRAPDVPRPQSTERYFVVSGVMAESGDEARLAPVQIVDLAEPPDQPDGPYALQLIGPGGSVLVSTSFVALRGRSPHGADSGRRVFTVALPYRSDVRGVVVTREGTEIARRQAGATPPEVSILSPADGAVWDASSTLSWEGTDPDGDTLSYDVYVSPDGVRWSAVALGIRETELPWLGPDDMEAGPDPHVRVVALDGVHGTAADHRITLRGGFRVLSATPGLLGDTIPPGLGRIAVHFNRPVEASTLRSGTLRLLDPDGLDVPGRLELDDSGRRARLLLDSPLRPGATYEIRVSDEVSDRFGNALARSLRWSFQTEPDRRRPRVEDMWPRPRALALDPSTVVRIRFDEEMDVRSIGAPGLQVEDVQGRPVPGTWSYDEIGSVATFEPAAPWTGGEAYRVVVTEDVTDLAGNALRTPDPWSFRVAGPIDPEP